MFTMQELNELVSAIFKLIEKKAYEVNDYLEKQNSKYKVLSVEQKDGHFILTILKAYNRTPMLDEKEGE